MHFSHYLDIPLTLTHNTQTHLICNTNGQAWASHIGREKEAWKICETPNFEGKYMHQSPNNLSGMVI